MRVSSLLVVLLLAPLTDVLGQEQPLQPGQRVRVTVPDLGIDRLAATFNAFESGMLTVTADSTMRIPLASVTRLDLYQGRHGHPWRGAGLGFLGGAAIGTAIGAAVADPGDEFEAVIIVICTAVGAGGGALIGALVGFIAKTDKWEKVPLDRVRVSGVPQRDGFGIRARITF